MTGQANTCSHLWMLTIRRFIYSRLTVSERWANRNIQNYPRLISPSLVLGWASPEADTGTRLGEGVVWEVTSGSAERWAGPRDRASLFHVSMKELCTMIAGHSPTVTSRWPKQGQPAFPEAKVIMTLKKKIPIQCFAEMTNGKYRCQQSS